MSSFKGVFYNVVNREFGQYHLLNFSFKIMCATVARESASQYSLCDGKVAAAKPLEIAVNLLDSGLTGRKVGNNKGGALHNIIYGLINILGNRCARNVGNLGEFRRTKSLALALLVMSSAERRPKTRGFEKGVGGKAVGAVNAGVGAFAHGIKTVDVGFGVEVDVDSAHEIVLAGEKWEWAPL